MARRPLNSWIADFVKDEIEAVLAWSNRKTGKGFIKLEHDNRFSDDGSNFRNVIASPEIAKSDVQLIEVLSCEEPVVVVLSDGQTHVKGRLSASVVETFEAALGEGERLDLEVTGDVVRLKSFTIVTTAFGSEEDYIQFTVEEIDYCHHLRKTFGDPVSIEKDSRIRPLIGRVIKSRIPDDAVADMDAEQDSVHSQVEEVEHAAYPSIDVPRSSPSVEPASRLPVVAGAPTRTVTRPHKRSAADAGLEEDGFEIQSGVNLDRPVHAAQKPGAGLRTNLLGLLTNRQAEPDTIAETPFRALPQHRPHQELQESDGNAISRDVSQRNKGATPDHTQDADIRSSPPVHTPTIPKQSYTSLLSGDESTNSLNARLISKRVSIPYGRRKIPANQKKLLALPASWIPSLPGQTFPKPNVPIELLKTWNALPAKVTTPTNNTAATSPGKSISPSRFTPHRIGSEQAVAETPKSRRRSPSLQSKSSDSDEEIPSSQWSISQPPSLPKKNPDKPPVSSIGSVIHDVSDLEDSPSKAASIQSTPDLEVCPPKAATNQKRAPSGPATYSRNSPTRSNVPLPLPPHMSSSLNEQEGRGACSPAPSLPRRPIPTGPRSMVGSGQFRGDRSSSGRPDYGPRRCDAVRSQSYRPEAESTPRSSQSYRPIYSPARPASAAASRTLSVVSADASPLSSRHSSRAQVSQSPRSGQHSHAPTRPENATFAEAHSSPHPNTQASPRGAERAPFDRSGHINSWPNSQPAAVRSPASSQQLVNRPPRSAQQVSVGEVRAAPAEEYSPSDKRPAFERTLGPLYRPALHPASSRPASGQSIVDQPASSSQRPTRPASVKANAPPLPAVIRPTSRPSSAGMPHKSRQSTLASVPSSDIPLEGTRPGFHIDSMSSDGPSQVPATRSSPTRGASSHDTKHPRVRGRNDSTAQQSPALLKNDLTAIPLQTANRPAQKPKSTLPTAPSTGTTRPPFPTQHPTGYLNPGELHRRQRQAHRREQELRRQQDLLSHAQQDRAHAVPHKIPAHSPPISYGHPSSTTFNSISVASMQPSSAVINPADDSNRTPLSKQHPNRRRTGFTGTSGSPANQRRLAKTAIGTDGDEEVEGGRSAAGGAESRTTLEARKSRFTERASMVRSGERHDGGADAEADAQAQAEADRNRMREFYESYMQLAPGGAFADGGSSSRRRRRPRVDVLQWDV